ncbi:MAG: DUF4238 domain-containing protein [Candidatus Dadabacteria bacterium]|nr:DUF4238 domain-containing protein [Candidatus Dadabacteria bacterium]MDE0477935.1 DUF4238 domain-containing protein [Candidatus Dadabacteria bacterium]
MLLKNFSFRKNGSELLYFFDKNSSGKGIREISPRDFCVEKDIYTQYEEDGSRDVSEEKDFSRLEARTGKITKKIMEAVRTKKRLRLSRNERRTLCHFFLRQGFRIPDRSDSIAGRDFIIRSVSNPETLKKPRKEIDASRAKERLKFLTRYSEPPEEILSFFEGKDPVVRVVSDGEENFVIGSNPVLLMEPDNHLPEIWLPIASNVAVTPCSTRGNDGFIESGDLDIHSFNKDVFVQSRMIAGNSEKLIRSIVSGWGSELI